MSAEPYEGFRSPPVHGGDLAAIGRRYGVAPNSLLDFSANLNPLGPPATLLRALQAAANDITELARYPEPDARSLRLRLGVFLNVEPEAIVVANGAAALLAIALATLGTRRCVVPSPAFSEDRHAVEAVGARYCGVALDARRDFILAPESLLTAVQANAADVCLLTNPHNPTGGLVSREAMLRLIMDVRRLGAATIVDEAFVDYALASSITSEAAVTPRLIAVRSLTKFFAVPALRVGYAVAAPDLARRMRDRLPSWPVTTLAMRALEAALGDVAYATRTLAENAQARQALSADLMALGVHVAPSAANFLFLTLPSGAASATHFVRRLVLDARIVVRDCSSYEGLTDSRHIRVAVRSQSENSRLVRALSSALAAT